MKLIYFSKTIAAYDLKVCTFIELNDLINLHEMDGWMTCDFTSFFYSISVISGRCLDDNERLCAMELRLWMRRFHLE